jgi:hypothetical protein
VTVALHAAADDRAFEYVERGEQSGGAMAFVVVGHGAAAALLDRQAWLGAIERLDLALLVERKHHGMGRGINVEAHHIPELGREVGVVGQLEAADAVGRETMGVPDASH